MVELLEYYKFRHEYHCPAKQRNVNKKTLYNFQKKFVMFKVIAIFLCFANLQFIFVF